MSGRSLVLDAACDKIERLAAKWRPYVQGKQQLKVRITNAETGELLATRAYSQEECRVLAHAEMDPLVDEAINLSLKV